jgi:RimJ/RimL family protein N-acetyltransferase
MWNDIELDAELTSQRLALKPLRREHADEMHPLLDDPKLHEFIGGSPLGLDDLHTRYLALERRASPDGQELWLNWIAQRLKDEALVGHLQATVSGSRAILAWVIGSRWQRKGYASEAAARIMDWLFEEVGVEEVDAHIYPAHVASERVATRLGLEATDEMVEGERVWRLAHPRR